MKKVATVLACVAALFGVSATAFADCPVLNDSGRSATVMWGDEFDERGNFVNRIDIAPGQTASVPMGSWSVMVDWTYTGRDCTEGASFTLVWRAPAVDVITN